MIWPEFENYLIKDDITESFVSRCGDIEDTEPEEIYRKIWKDISFVVQLRKASNYRLTKEQASSCFRQLIRRPFYLAKIAKEFSANRIVEIGTAEGLQFYSFAEAVRHNGGHVWSCDISDKRNKKYDDLYKDYTTFVLGDSSVLAKEMNSENNIDLFYVDASHKEGAVLRDVECVKHMQSDSPIWVFDDFDTRFGCFNDIQTLCKKTGRFKIYRVGNAASGNPNHQVIIFGKL